MSRSSFNRVKIQGLVSPADWDEEGNVIAVSIATFDEDEYFVLRNSMGQKILPLLHKVVEIDGAVKQINKRKHIEIAEFHLIKSPR